MTEEQRIERARQAAQAMETFLAPAFHVVAEEYHDRLAAICATRPWATNEIAALANATRIVGEVQRQIEGLIHDGAAAKDRKDRAARIADLTPAKRRLLGIGQF